MRAFPMRTPLLLAAAGLIGFVLQATPATADDTSRQEKSLDKAAASIDQTGTGTEGQSAVTDRLEKTFNVDQARIDGLRSQNLGFGEVSIVLALSQKMTGGITDANVQSILAMRTGTPPKGWGAIAKSLGENLGTVVSEVNRVAQESHQQAERLAHAGKPDASARGDKPQKPERPQKPDRPEKPGKP